MSDLTINSTIQAAAPVQRNNSSSVAAVSTPAPQVNNVIKAGEFSQLKGAIDNESMYVIQFRDSESGEVRMQYPSKKAATAYQKTASVVEAKHETPAPAPAASSAPAPHAGGEKAASVDSGPSQSS